MKKIDLKKLTVEQQMYATKLLTTKNDLDQFLIDKDNINILLKNAITYDARQALHHISKNIPEYIDCLTQQEFDDLLNDRISSRINSFIAQICNKFPTLAANFTPNQELINPAIYDFLHNEFIVNKADYGYNSFINSDLYIRFKDKFSKEYLENCGVSLINKYSFKNCLDKIHSIHSVENFYETLDFIFNHKWQKKVLLWKLKASMTYKNTKAIYNEVLTMKDKNKQIIKQWEVSNKTMATNIRELIYLLFDKNDRDNGVFSQEEFNDMINRKRPKNLVIKEDKFEEFRNC